MRTLTSAPNLIVSVSDKWTQREILAFTALWFESNIAGLVAGGAKGESMSKPLNAQIIKRARSLIEDEQNWCRGRAAVDLSGNQVHPADARATRRCALGAFIAAAHEIVPAPAMAEEVAYDAVWSFTSPMTLFTINDLWGHAAVLRRLDEAIAAS